jgi:Fe-S-cluster formation regulator IscX/YfhJ
MRDKLQHVGPQQALHLVQLLSTVSSNTETNLTATQLLTLYRRYHDVDPKNIRHVSLKPLTELFMVTRFDDPGEAVRPRSGTYTEFQQMEANIFKSNQEISTEDQIHLAAAPVPKPAHPQSMLSAVN